MVPSESERVLVVRRRPAVVNGGGFVVTDSSTHKVVFRVDGYGFGVRGTKPHLILTDDNGKPLLLLVRPKGGMVGAMSNYRKWKGYEGSQTKKLVFSLKEPKKSCLVKNTRIRICTEPRTISEEAWDFEVRGYFPDKTCTIVDSRGNLVAQVGVKKEVEELMENKDLYHVVVKPGIHHVIVFGVIAILDNIYRES